MADFCVFGGKFGAKRGMYVLLRWLWKWQGLVQREGQARQGCLKRVCPKFRKDAKQIKAHTDAHPTKSEWDSAENLIDGADGEQSLSLDGRKVCNIKRVGISQAESNKATVCALPSIHLPLTRGGKGVSNFRGIVRFWEGWCGAWDSAEKAVAKQRPP